ncbi:diguanylate cyclase domain-containing protein [Pseudidiomarina sp.]|uniref:diguanylate cyclase domain-containing protein n=1 Tax=Pseudidiomarina sp. TaxID=2081707 RepID=UPI00299E7538|nr:diguanylate cyclase [Pseudidiomarina sp.]MDX1706545.1 diguanylate cyclase [Pseudidiomarina sp.]
MRIWTTQDGLPHGSVNHITQDKQGYIWIASWRGPVRFNGRFFEVIGKDARLPDVGTLFITNDPRTDNLVVTGARGGISYFDGGKWQPKPPVANRVDYALFDTAGRSWFATLDSGVTVEDADGNRRQYTTADGLPINAVLHIMQDSQGRIWLGTSEGAALYNEKRNRFDPVAGVPAGNVLGIIETTDGRILLSSDKRVFVSDVRTLDFSPWPVSYPSTITELHEDNHQQIWIGTHEDGITQLTETPPQMTDTSKGMPNNHILSLFSDREDNLWVGTHGGLVQFRKALLHTHTKADGLGFSYVRTVTELPDKSILVGGLGGLSVIDGEASRGYATAVPVHRQSVLSLMMTADNTLYVGTFTNGIYVLRDEQLVAHYDETSGFPGYDIRKIIHASDGKIYAATLQGLMVADRHPDGTLSNPNYYTMADGLPDDIIYSLHEDRNQQIWIGSMLGISQLDRETNKIVPVNTKSFSDAQIIFGIQEDSTHVWFATDRGILAWEHARNRWGSLTSLNGLPFDTFFDIAFDLQGNLWLGSPSGLIYAPRNEVEAIFARARNSIEYQYFTESQGLAGAQLNPGGPSVYQAGDGSIWLATAKGVGHFKPSDLRTLYPVPPPVVISDVLVDGNRLAETGTVGPDAKRIRFNYAGMGYQHPEGISYRARLIGYDTDWIDRDDRLDVEYTYLPPGAYTLEVQAAYPGSGWSSGTTFRFTKTPALYQRPLVWFIIALLLVAGIFAAVRWRLRALSRTRNHLETLVAEQTRTLSKLANQDSMTGLANRRAFDWRLHQSVEQQKHAPQPMALVILDLDHFKQVNDLYLHTTGDQVLKRIAVEISHSARDSDLLARWGGEEFALLLSGDSAASAEQICERLRKNIAETDFSDLAPDLSITASFGLAYYQQNETAANFVRRADKALYAAKHGGRNQVKVAQPS